MTDHGVEHRGLDLFQPHPVLCTWLQDQIEVGGQVAPFAKKHGVSVQEFVRLFTPGGGA
jgi:hypothetical protein